LSEAARWGKFLAIIGFIGCVFIVLAGIVMATQSSELDRAFSTYGEENPFEKLGPGIAVVYILLAALYFFPCLYLLRFSSHMQTAIASGNQEKMTSAFKNLKSMFKFVGILTIIIIAIYILAIVVMGVAMV
jgi:drug/metabolite transporter (DMT)-like permease